MPFSDVHADRAVRFIEKLPHTKGQWARTPFRLYPWQRDEIIRPLFGTLRADGTRQYRTAYVELPRKNGKSTLAAGIANYLLYADGEEGAEVYGAAYTRDQASIVFNTAARMVELTPRLLGITELVKSRKRMYVPGTDSFYQAVSADASNAHGWNAHGLIFDELHTQKTRELWDVLTTSQGARQQPLIVAITTAGHDRYSICWEQHQYALSLLKLRHPEEYAWSDAPTATQDDPSFFAYVRCAPSDADWQDERIWHLSNPGLGDFRSLEELRDLARKAAQVPAEQNKFRRLYLNQWTSTETRWLDLSAWDRSAGEVDAVQLEGARAYAGLDLAYTNDLAAFELIVPIDGKFKIISWFWMAANRVTPLRKESGAPIDEWVRRGLIRTTPGDVLDYDAVQRDIVAILRRYRVQELAYDPMTAFQMMQGVSKEIDEIEVVEVKTNFGYMSHPTKEFARLMLDRRLEHGGNPVLRWMADNVVVLYDENDNVRPSKKRSPAKIDGIVASIIALDRALRGRTTASIYDERGIRTI